MNFRTNKFLFYHIVYIITIILLIVYILKPYYLFTLFLISLCSFGTYRLSYFRSNSCPLHQLDFCDHDYFFIEECEDCFEHFQCLYYYNCDYYDHYTDTIKIRNTSCVKLTNFVNFINKILNKLF